MGSVQRASVQEICTFFYYYFFLGALLMIRTTADTPKSSPDLRLGPPYIRFHKLSDSLSVVLQITAVFEIFPLYREATPALLFFSRAQFTQIQSGTNQKNFKPNFMGPGIYLSICSMFWCEIIQSRSLAAVQLFLSLKQLIHSGITKAEGLIEMFSHFSLPRRRIVNHSSVVYFEISFGVWASAALFFTETSQSAWLVCVCALFFS